MERDVPFFADETLFGMTSLVMHKGYRGHRLRD